MHSVPTGNGQNAKQDLRLKMDRLDTGRPLRVLDLFAGCGGLSLGFQRAGFTILGGIEWDPQAASTHAVNFFKGRRVRTVTHHSAPLDITEVRPDRYLKDILSRKRPSGLVDVIAGGPPCQAFARIGRAKLREIMNHPQAFLNDDRASLYTNFLEYVEFFRPLAVLMENVPDIMNFGGQNVAEEIACTLRDLGYTCSYTILNAAHYGVPQMRQRFFLLGLHTALGITPDFPAPTHFIDLPQGYGNAQQVALSALGSPLFSNPTGYLKAPMPDNALPPAVTAQDALGDLPPITSHLRGEGRRGVRRFDRIARYRTDVSPSSYALAMREWPGFSSAKGIRDHVTRYLPRDYPIFERMQAGDQYPEAHALALTMFQEALDRAAAERGAPIPPDSEEYRALRSSMVPPYVPDKFPNRWRKMEPDQPARTLTAHIGKDTYSHIHYDSDQARTISVREAARLQSFPDGFTFTGAMNSAFRQIGNAVPPLLACALAGHIQRILNEAARTSRADGPGHEKGSQ